jgi:amino-acid N-acetyltransferase
MIAVTVVDVTIAVERDELAVMLSAAGLPTTDLNEPHRIFLRFGDANTVGFAGIEGAGEDRLLRSVVVAPAGRGAGVGRDIVAATEREAARRGTRRLHVLTEDAAPFFARAGYAANERADAPAAIVATTQFSSLCPATATYMTKSIGDAA